MSPGIISRLLHSGRVCSIVAIIAALAAISFAAPPPRGKTKAVDGTRYLPLKLGRVMKYQVTVEPPLGKPRKAAATNRVAEKTVLDGKTYYKVTTTITGVPLVPDTLIYYRSAPNGVYQVLAGDEESPEWLYLPGSIEIGDRWGAKTLSGDFEFAAAGFEDVETPCGKYPRCLKLSVVMKKTLGTNTQTQWLAAGVGVVRQTDSNAIFASKTVLEEVKTDKPDTRAGDKQ